MTNEMGFEVKKTAAGPLLCFIIMMCAGAATFAIPESFLIAVPILFLFSACYFIYYLLHTGQHKNIISGIVTSIIITVVAMMIPVVGWFALALWILYNIVKSLETIKKLFPQALFSAILLALLVTPGMNCFIAYSPSSELRLICFAAYSLLCVIYCLRLNKFQLDTQAALFKFSMMWLSAPMIFLLVVSIVASLRTAFRTQTSFKMMTSKVPQKVSPHLRSGSFVKGYTRSVTRITPIPSTNYIPSTGAITASAARSLSDTTSSSEGLSRDPWNMHDLTATDKALNFYRNDNFDAEKLGNFLKSLNAAEKHAQLELQDILFYFDDTVFGKGDRGVAITRDAIICHLGKIYDNFVVELNNIKAVSISGSLNKTIKIAALDGKRYTFTLTQSNKGAEKFFYVLNTLIP